MPPFIALLATRHMGLTALGIVTIFLLLRQGLTAAMRPGSTRAQAVRNLLMAVAGVVCLVAAAGALHLISPD